MRKEYYQNALNKTPSDSLEDLSEIEDAAATSADKELMMMIEDGEVTLI